MLMPFLFDFQADLKRDYYGDYYGRPEVLSSQLLGYMQLFQEVPWKFLTEDYNTIILFFSIRILQGDFLSLGK